MENYTKREKYDLYASMAITPLTVTSATYVGLFQGNIAEDPWYVTLTKGALALACNIPILKAEVCIGAGLFLASKKHKKDLEQKIEE